MIGSGRFIDRRVLSTITGHSPKKGEKYATNTNKIRNSESEKGSLCSAEVAQQRPGAGLGLGRSNVEDALR